MTTLPEPCRVCGLYPPFCRGHSTITGPGLDGVEVVAALAVAGEGEK